MPFNSLNERGWYFGMRRVAVFTRLPSNRLREPEVVAVRAAFDRMTTIMVKQTAQRIPSVSFVGMNAVPDMRLLMP